jgi:IS5 family transposase
LTTLKERLIVSARTRPGSSSDGNAFHEALEQAEILSEVKPLLAFVDRGCRGVEVAGMQIWKSSQRRGVKRRRKAMTKRRSFIEPTIGHMKNDDKLRRNWLKGALGNAMHAVLYGAGQNIRLIINKLKSC